MKTITSSAQFGNIIKKIRKGARLTQKELAASCGTGVRFIQELERGKSSCELDKALHVASMLGMRLEARLPILDETHG